MEWELLRLGDVLRPPQIKRLRQFARDDEAALKLVRDAVDEKLGGLESGSQGQPNNGE